MFISSGSGARGKTLIWLKNYDVPKKKWQIAFTLGLNAGENTDYMEKSFK